MKIFILIILCPLATAAMADDLSVQLHVGSEHWIESRQQNESNPGAGLAYDKKGGLSVIAGGYYNTESSGTQYFAVGRHIEAWGGEHRFLIGAATGYEGHSFYPMFGWQFTTHGILGTLLPGAFGYGGEKRLLSW